ncbi:hypothetical protein J4E96_14810 [Pengzhenrongella sicca]|uniref:Uncharacterized protein n=1 Tax=Pengzhenrongella sicca TaxID=2819238 RepID=A0A8A4ZJW1_9MICO|nr:hypothetical protein J4E96_14810 [Pengzhenrongella sicca]
MGPDFGAVAASVGLARIVGALLTVALIAAVGVLVGCAVTWAISSTSGSWHTAARARTGVLVALGGAALTGSALAWVNWLLHTGASL